MTTHRSSLYQSEQDRADMALVREHDGDRGLSDLVNRLVRQRANQIRAKIEMKGGGTMYAEILQSVIENGRVLDNGDGTFQTASLEVEVEFEAGERGLGQEDITEAVKFALRHAKHH